MNRTLPLVVGVFVLVAPLLASAQVKNEGLANQIIAAREKNSASMKQFTWNSRTEFMLDGAVKDTRIDAVSYGPEGNLQQVVINDDKASMPRGFLRRAAAQNERKEIEKYINGLHELLNKYTLSSAGATIDFISKAAVQTGQAPDGTPILTIAGNGVITPGDSVTLTVNPTNFQTVKMEISTLYDEHQVTMSASFKTMPGGLTHLQLATVQAPDKTITLQIHNYDYQPLVVVVPPPAAGAAIPIGATVAALPPGFVSLNVNGQQYYQCGPTWYRPYFAPNGAYMYAVVAAP
jgi:hypothetical protein